jgi:protoporphyrinogen oxidase
MSYIFFSCICYTGLQAVFVPQYPFKKPMIFYGACEPFRQRCQEDDESVDDFFTRRFGPEV